MDAVKRFFNYSEHNCAIAYKMVVGIDFGTTTSAMAYSYENKPEEIFVFKDYSDGTQTSGKVPTAIIFDLNKRFLAFGNASYSKYEEFAMKDKHDDVYFFQNFKMKLYNEDQIDENLMLSDITGKLMNAEYVFTAAVNFFKTMILNDVKQRKASLRIVERDVKWVITVPAIWNENAKQFMRTAAEKAGCYWRSVIIALEPEAASIYCRQSPLVQQNHFTILKIKCPTYFVIDIGGGTLDITAHQVDEEQAIREIHRASGNDCAGNRVDDAFFKLMESLFSAENIKKIQEEYPEEFMKIMREFKKAKQEVNFDNTAEVLVVLSKDCPWNTTYFNALPNSIKKGIYLTNKGGLFFPKQEIIKLIQATSKEIQNYVDLLMTKIGEIKKLDFVVMVGGFSKSKILVDAVRNLVKVPVVVPESSELCVVKGAVMFGWKQDIIRSRRLRKTYGIRINKKFIEGKHDEKRAAYDLEGEKYCTHYFEKLVTINDAVEFGEKVTSKRCHPYLSAKTVTLGLYATNDPDPLYADGKGVTFIGVIRVPTQESARGKVMDVEVYFGETEIKVVVNDEASGKTFTGNFKCNSSNNILKLLD